MLVNWRDNILRLDHVRQIHRFTPLGFHQNDIIIKRISFTPAAMPLLVLFFSIKCISILLLIDTLRGYLMHARSTALHD